MTVESDVLSGITDDWLSSKEIWDRMGVWAEQTVAQRLNLLSESGEIERMKEPMPRSHKGFKYLYRRRQK